MRTALVQFDIAWADPASNRSRLDGLLGSLPQVDLVVLPEMFSTGFATSPEGVAETSPSASLEWMMAKAHAMDCVMVGSIALHEGEDYFNRVYFVKPDGSVAKYDKHHLFTYSGEHHRFTRGTERVIVEWRGFRFLLNVCYDLRLPVWSRNRKDYDAMSEIMWAGSVSHCGLTELGRCKDFACHKLGHELSGRFDVTHGASLTAVWGAWANYVYRDDIARFAQFAAKIWGITEGSEEERAKAGIAATIAYFKEIGMPVNFTELGIGVQSDDVLEALADSCTAGGTKVVANFHPIDKQTAIAIYRLANQ